MNYYKKDALIDARRMDLMTYLRLYDPLELVHVSGETFCTREHDSLKISNGMWYWFSRGIGGRSALDYLIKVKGLPFTEAVGMILGRAAEMPPVSHIQTKSQEQLEFLERPGSINKPEAINKPMSIDIAGTEYQLKKEQKKELLLPKAVEGRPEKVIAYLVDRGIDRPLIDACINHKLLYESEKYHNAVFVGYDMEGVARYAAIRGTGGSYKGEATGSDKRFSFSLCLPRQPPTVHVFESAIDLLSYATLEHRTGRDWRGDALLSLAGVFKQKREKVVPVALAQFLSDHPSVKTVCPRLDDDEITLPASFPAGVSARKKEQIIPVALAVAQNRFDRRIYKNGPPERGSQTSRGRVVQKRCQPSSPEIWGPRRSPAQRVRWGEGGAAK